MSGFSGIQDSMDNVKKKDIINNLTSTATDKPLAAAQGKALNDNISTFKSFINEYIGNNATKTFSLESRKIYLLSISEIISNDVSTSYFAIVATAGSSENSGLIKWITSAPTSTITCTLSGFTLSVVSNGAWPIIALIRL